MSDSGPIVSIERVGQTAVVTLMCEELMADVVLGRLAESVMPLADAEEGLSVVMDFGKVKYVSSSLFSFLLTLKKELWKYGGKLKLCSVENKVTDGPDDRYVGELFKAVKLDTVFDMCDDVKEALASLA